MTKGTFPLKVKDSAKPYQAPPRHMACAQHAPFRKELERLWEKEILEPQGVDGWAKWYSSCVVVPKPNWTVCLCLDSARLNQAMIRPIHREQH